MDDPIYIPPPRRRLTWREQRRAGGLAVLAVYLWLGLMLWLWSFSGLMGLPAAPITALDWWLLAFDLVGLFVVLRELFKGEPPPS